MGEDCVSTELYIQNGVLVEEIEPNKGDIDFCDNLGTLKIVEYGSDVGQCIEWHQCRVSIESHDQEWAIVQDVNNHSEDSTQNCKKPTIQLMLEKLYYVEIHSHSNKLTLTGDEIKITFYFQNGNVTYFFNYLKGILGTSIRQKTSDLYIVNNQKEVKVLEKSFAELNLFTDEETRSTISWNLVKKFQEKPYETTMYTFSKVTNNLWYRLQRPIEPEKPIPDRFIGEEVTDSNARVSSDDYEVVTKRSPLPERTYPERGEPLSESQWIGFFDDAGRITNPEAVKEIIFHGGISSEGNLRKEVWKYLLDYYPWNSTVEERENLRKEKEKEYYRMKLQWQSMSAEQADRFGAYKVRMSLIEKDVHRTDRNMHCFAGDNNPNSVLLQDILMTYVMYNFDLGYVQGMSDLLSPLLVKLENEVDIFWCFVGFMNRMSRNFELDQEGMKKQLHQLYCLLHAVEPELAAFLDQDSKSMSFCFRWLLVWFKREFSYDDIYSVWEVLWSEHHGLNYHLFICMAILANEKETIMSKNFGFTEILKHINELANGMNVEQILRKAEGIYIQISNATVITPAIREILGLEPLLEVEENEKSEPDSEKCPSPNTLKDSFNAKLIEDEREIVFDQSLSLQYL